MYRLTLEVNSHLNSLALNDLKSHLQSVFNDSSIQLESTSFSNQLIVSIESPITKQIILKQKLLSHSTHTFVATENGYKKNQSTN